MLRRCVRELSSKRQGQQLLSRMPVYLLPRHEFSSAPRNLSERNAATQKPTSGNPQSGSAISKFVLGSVVVGAAVFAAYQTGYVDQLRRKDDKVSVKSDKQDIVKNSDEPSAGQVFSPSKEQVDPLSTTTENIEKTTEFHRSEDNESSNLTDLEAKEDTSESKPSEGYRHANEQELESLSQQIVPSSTEEVVVPEVPSGGKLELVDNADNGESSGKQSETTISPTLQDDQGSDSMKISEGVKTADHDPNISMEISKDELSTEPDPLDALARSYHLESAESPQVSEKEEPLDASTRMLKNEEVPSVASENSKRGSGPEEAKLVLDFIEAIHAAERRQAETDAYIFAEEKRKLKEKYEKELKDARARELMHAEEAAILDKELNKEKAKAAAAIKLLQEKAEQKLHEALKRKEEEAEKELRKAQELAKAELIATIAYEKSSQIEKIAEANLSIDALCMAFYARSEEARQTHSVHNLALGTLAFEDALSKGLPLQAEADALRKSLQGIDRDSLLALVLSSIPEETLTCGINTQMQLSEKFDSLKPTLRHLSLISAGGGGILAHAVAYIASSIKMKEDQCGDGIESLISKVERFIVDGRLAEAADALEAGVRSSRAQEVVTEWVKQARNRAVVEQALSLLQSYATSIRFS